MIAIVKYNAGNVFSVDCALRRIGVEAKITDDFDTLRNADKVIFPGVGEASTAMNYLREKGLDDLIKNLTQPVLGICVGLQLLCRHSEEGDTSCLGIFDTDVKRFNNISFPELKIPHMGWNTLHIERDGFIPKDLDGKFVYYVHSFYAETSPQTIVTTDYIQQFSAALQKDNFYATQFHPEKSGNIGEQILRNFIQL